MNLKKNIETTLSEIVSQMGYEDIEAKLTRPELSFGDFTTNVAMVLSAQGEKKNPRELADTIRSGLEEKLSDIVERVEVAGPGFINLWLKTDTLVQELSFGETHNSVIEGKKYLVEYAHPNTHKEMHIGHMRTLITGESVARILEANGGEVFRANYQGDIGPHVAKALYGVQVLMKEQDLTLEGVESWPHKDKAHFLGEGYIRGNIDYETAKEEIDGINNKLYEKEESIWPLYERTRQWSLEYYEDFYNRFYTAFDQLFFESQMVEPGKRIVKENIGKVFEEDNGAVIFPGEKYGLHTRVFITNAGNPTYEGKEMGNGFAEQSTFPFDEKIHVVGSEQAGYFQVVFKALELLDPVKFEGKQRHISMGMVTFTDRKMSSRTGDILKVDWLIDQVKERIAAMVDEGRIKSEDKEAVTEMIAIGAIKYSVLKVGTGQNVAFDIEKSVSLEGNSGPYIQYTYARTQSVLSKSKIEDPKIESGATLEGEENDLLRYLGRYSDAVEQSGSSYSPNILCEYLYDLAKRYNLFYQKQKIIGSENEAVRLALTQKTGFVIENGLSLLGIKAPQRM